MIGHPGRQHSHHLASGLMGAGLLSGYCSGQFNENQLDCMPGFLTRVLPSALVRNAVPFFGKEVSSTRPAGTVLNYLARRIPARNAQIWGELAGFAWFDQALSRLVRRKKPRAVIGYEMACLQSFRTAKQLGAICILDAAACHHSLQDQRMPDLRASISRPGRLIRERKDAELALADLLICPSPLSAQSYLDAGVAPQRIMVNPLGVSETEFKGAAGRQREGQISFVFVANARTVKGADFIESAVRALQVAGLRATMHLVGGAKVHAQSGGTVQVVHHGHVSHQELAGIFGGADCLLLPSRLESFGMVVLEAMAAGMPVVVSDWVGAAALVNQGVDGWRYGDTLENFLERVLWCADNVGHVRAMGPACVETARHNSWDAYQRRAADIVRNVISGS